MSNKKIHHGVTRKVTDLINRRFTLWNPAFGRFARGEIPQGKRRHTQTFQTHRIPWNPLTLLPNANFLTILTRMFHELLAATLDMAVLPRVLGSSSAASQAIIVLKYPLNSFNLTFFNIRGHLFAVL
jgi:hypothetical protein